MRQHNPVSEVFEELLLEQLSAFFFATSPLFVVLKTTTTYSCYTVSWLGINQERASRPQVEQEASLFAPLVHRRSELWTCTKTTRKNSDRSKTNDNKSFSCRRSSRLYYRYQIVWTTPWLWNQVFYLRKLSALWFVIIITIRITQLTFRRGFFFCTFVVHRLAGCLLALL